ncbi:phage tail protein [Oceanobacillus oncorhynchi]|uniref:phage tail protein n=1 Tax=Oceanobacillus oncorhynchi TaxID=545501 RepID=UPI0021170724|nr:phage tail protein [Oceanobacillus oncorhynchi]UUI41190.1 phage tail protein [Oceanobacillus oncorhynchi]
MEVFIFSQDELPLTVITAETGLIEAPYRIEINSVPTEPFSFVVSAQHPTSEHVKEENKVVFRDHEGDYRLFVIKRLKDSSDISGSKTRAVCLPVYHAELNDHVIEERRFIDQIVDVAMEAAVQGTRWQAAVEVELGRATTNFYRIFSTEALEDIIATWGGEIKDVVTFDERTNRITGCYLKLIQRHGKEHGQRMEIGHNVVEIEREVLSYPKTALYGFGSSLEVEDDEGEHTGGYTRYIDFGEVEWKKSNGDPVDKPLGQKWVGDSEALKTYGYEGGVKHRFGIFSNQDYEDPEDLLHATWEALQKANKPEVNYRLSVNLFNKKVSLGDTCQAIDRKFARPIEIQARVIAMEYDLMDIEGTMVVEMGQFLDLGDDRIDNIEREIEDIKNRPPKQIIDEGSYPDRKPSTPVNLEAYGGMEVIQLYWQYADEMFIKHYEVYGSRTEDFVPDTQHLLWRGDVSAFSHTVGTDEVWYYRVRAVNYHGRPSDWSVQIRAATNRVLTEDIMWGPELAERMRELHRISDIIGENGVDFDQISEEAKDLINQQARIYTDKEIQETREDVMRDISEISDNLQYIDGQLIDKVNVGDVYTIENIDDMFENTVSITQYETDMGGIVKDLNHQESLIKQNEEEILNRVKETTFNEETGYLRNSIADVVLQADRIEQTVSSIEIGGTNLNRDSNNFSREVLSFYDGSALSKHEENVSVEEWGATDATEIRAGAGNATASLKVLKNISNTTSTVEGKVYTVSFYVKNLRDVPMSVNINGLSPRPTVDLEANEAKRVVVSGERSTSNLQLQFRAAGNTFYTHFIVWRAQVEEGNMVTPWKPAIEDTDQRMTQAESNITQLDRKIDLKVDVDGIVSEINLMKEGIRLAGALIHLNGLSLIDEAIIQNAHIADGTIERAKLERAIIGTAQIDDLAVTSAKISSVNADKINAATLQAITANMGTLRSGRLLSNNNNMDLNLNTGNLTMRNAHFTLGSGARIEFTNVSNRIQYRDAKGGITRSAGFGVGKSLQDYPFAYSGTTGDANLNTLSPYYSGAMWHTTRAIAEGASNSISGFRFMFRNRAVDWDKSIEFDFNGTPTIKPRSHGEYDIGTSGFRFRRIYVDNVLGWRTVYISNPTANRGFAIDTDHVDGHNPSIYGQYPADNNYNIGRSNRYMTYVYTNTVRANYLYGALQGGSARKLKKNEGDMHLEDSLEFIRNAKIVTFDWRRDESMKFNKDNPQSIYDRQVGFIIDDLKMRNDYLVKSDEETIKKDNILFMHQHVIQDSLRRLDNIDEELNWQRIEYQYINNEVTKLKEENKALKERVKKLEESAA